MYRTRGLRGGRLMAVNRGTDTVVTVHPLTGSPCYLKVSNNTNP